MRYPRKKPARSPATPPTTIINSTIMPITAALTANRIMRSASGPRAGWVGVPRRWLPWRQRCRSGASEPSRLLLQLCPDVGRDILEGRRLTQLKRADVGDDRPAIWHRHLSGVRRHGAESVCDHVEEV